MSETKMYEVSSEWQSHAHIDNNKYLEMYKASVDNPEEFWGEQGKMLDWMKPYTKVKNTSFAHENVDIKWYEDGTLNVCYNCVDRHLEKRGDQVAIIWEGDDPTEDETITYKQLHERVCKFANLMKAHGVKRAIASLFWPMIPEAASRSGLYAYRRSSLHCVCGLSPDALAGLKATSSPYHS